MTYKVNIKIRQNALYFKGLILLQNNVYYSLMTEKLTEKQKKFVSLVVEGLTPTKAAKLAGYTFAKQSAQALRHNEHVQKEIFNGQMAALTLELLPKSFRRIDEILDDLSPAPAGIKLKAAQYVIDKAMELQAMVTAQDVANKNPLEMTGVELEMFVMRGRAIVSREKANAELGIIDQEPLDRDE